MACLALSDETIDPQDDDAMLVLGDEEINRITETASIKAAPVPPVTQREQPAEATDEHLPQQRKDGGQVDEERSEAPVSMLYFSAEKTMRKLQEPRLYAQVLVRGESHIKMPLSRKAAKQSSLFLKSSGGHGGSMREYAQLILITGVMAALEMDDKILLGIFATSGSLIVVGDLKVLLGGSTGNIVAGVFLALVLVGLLAMRNTIRGIGEMDRYAKHYKAIEAKHLVGSGDDLGPASKTSNNVKQKHATKLDALLQRAEELVPDFKAHVSTKLSVSGGGTEPREVHGPCVKGRARAEQKIRNDYNDDASLLKDVLRCSIICSTMQDLCLVFAALLSLAAEGIVIILQVRWQLQPTGPAACALYCECNVTPLGRSCADQEPLPGRRSGWRLPRSQYKH